jgi:hypothetical protein
VQPGVLNVLAELSRLKLSTANIVARLFGFPVFSSINDTRFFSLLWNIFSSEPAVDRRRIDLGNTTILSADSLPIISAILVLKI